MSPHRGFDDTPFTPSRVVLAYDGSAPAITALETAAGLARDRGVELVLVCSVQHPDQATLRWSVDSARTILDAALDRCRATLGVPRTTGHLGVGSAVREVLDVARPDDLLVVGTHSSGVVARALMGSTSSALVTRARQPVLVVREAAVAPQAPVVVGVDGSPSCAAAVRLAAAHADAAEVPLLAVAAAPPLVDASGYLTGPSQTQVERAAAELAEAVAGLADRYPDLVVQQEVDRAHPVEALVRASRHARLLVVGSRGRSGLRSIGLGSVSRKVVQLAHCSVLVVPASRTRTPVPSPDPAVVEHPVG